MGNFSAQNITQNAFQSEPGGDIFTKKICIIDTCVILSRPQIINTILKCKRYHKVVVPEVVIKELNYQKDHGDTDSISQKAWLAMKTIQEKKDSIIIEQCEKSEDKNNDEKIMWIAKQYSCKNYIIELLTNDIYFSLSPELSSCKSISVLLIRDLDKILYEKDEYSIDEYSIEDTQKFIEAVKTKELNRVKEAYKPSVNINKIDSSTGWPPLIQAIRDRNYKVLEYLLSLCEINLENRDNARYLFTPLLHCCQIKDIKIMRLLINHGANVNSSGRGKNRGNTPLMVCSWGGFSEGVKFLISNNSTSFNQQDSNGFTALHKACIKNNYEIIKLLIDKIDKNIEDFENKKAFEYLDQKRIEFKRIRSLFGE